MKVKDVVAEVQQEITEERKKKVKAMLKEKKRELDAAKKVYDKLDDEYHELLEKDVDDFVFPHEDEGVSWVRSVYQL